MDTEGKTEFFKNKYVLVTGGEGFVGFNFVQRLAHLGANVRATYYKEKPDFSHQRVDFVQCDLLENANTKKVSEDIEYIFHCAAVTSGAGGMSLNPLGFIKPNITMNMNILESCIENKVKKIMTLSSTTGYPDMGARLIKEESFFNGDPFEKYMSVGWVNRYTEVLCKIFSQYSPNSFTTVVLRPTNIYGEYDNFDLKTSQVLPALIRKVVERHIPIEVWGTGEDIRDLIYIHDFIFLEPLYRRVTLNQAIKHLGNADIIAFSVYVWNFQLSLEIARIIKQKRPDVLIVLGGSHVPNNVKKFLKQN